MKIEITDRYDALGIARPNPKTVCKGHCDGIGWVPVYRNTDVPRIKNHIYLKDETNYRLQILWDIAHKHYRLKRIVTLLHNPFSWYYWRNVFERFDGWHFVMCPDCKGTGKGVQND